MKFSVFVTILLTLVYCQVKAQVSDFTGTKSGNPGIKTVKAEKGQTLFDFMDPSLLKEQQTDINPGVDPEGDFMLRSTFTNDGSKILVCNGGTDNVTVFDWETMEAIAVIEVGNYPCDVAVTDDYAIIPCIFGDEIYVVDLDDYSNMTVFAGPTGIQPAVVEVSPDGQYAYIASDINDGMTVINLSDLSLENTFSNFPIHLLTYSWISTGGRSTFKFSRFEVSPDGQHLIVGNADNEVLYINTSTGNVDYSIPGIPNCFVMGLSGDGSKTIALSDENNIFQAFQIDNTTHQVTGTVALTGNYLATFEVGVNQDGSKAFVGIGNNSSAIVRFATSDFVVFTQTYTPFWIGTSPDHQYAINGQYRFSVLDFETESIVGQKWGWTQDFGCVSPVNLNVVGYDPLRYEGIYYFNCNDPTDIDMKGKTQSGWPPEGDTPYRIAISPDGNKAVTSNSLSENTSIIDLTTYTVDTIIFLEEKSDAIGITHNSEWAILGGYDLQTIKLINLSTNELVTTVQTGQRPLMVAISPDDNYAYIGNLQGNSVSIVELDGASSHEVADIPTGVIGLVWAAFGVRSSVEVDPTGQYILVAASFEDKVQVIDIAQQEIVANLPVGTFPLKIAFNNNGDFAAVTNYNSDNFSIIHVDGENSSVVGTYSSNGDGPLRLAYNPVNDEFGIINYSSKTVINVDAQTGAIISTDYYTQYGNPIQIFYDPDGNPIVLTLSNNDSPGHLVRAGEAIELPATPTYFDYCPATNTAVVCMPGPDFVTVVEYNQTTVPPVANFTANVTTVQVGENVEFTDLSQNNPTSWEWDFEGGTPMVSSEPNPTVIYDTEGSFDVSLTVTNDAGSDTKTETDYINVLPLTFIDESGFEQKVSVHPNPATDMIYIDLVYDMKTTLTASVYSPQGKLLTWQNLKSKQNVLDISNLENGLYILKLGKGSHSKSIKLIKK
ncbi:MAG: beta-propeller fold lactonase family protein [Bacteroidales bacterium]|nr:beta-propeller fold lactonase family protein [Bacteroidales bacterium]